MTPTPWNRSRGRGRRCTGRVLRATALAGLAVGGAVSAARVLTGGPDADLALAGDHLLSDAPVIATHGIDIAAAPEQVWPWLVQMGVGRGGFYTYDWVERAAGLAIDNADAIEPDWQNLAVGDQVHLSEDLALGVALLDPGHALVLSSAGASAGPTRDFDFTWVFVILSSPTGCRLLIRERYVPHGPAAWGVVAATLPVSCLMTRGMLAGVRRRAEAADSASPADDGAPVVPGAES